MAVHAPGAREAVVPGGGRNTVACPGGADALLMSGYVDLTGRGEGRLDMRHNTYVNIRERCGLKEDVVARVERGMLRWFGIWKG
ncbi:hypothetical protein EVAR_14510_1 [Eumeta japonica]|uniref:Uncharacterized protein n=1 Tax=Eumeta variegata TaxID=151549 RepID=A0A4C1U3Z6_EUMVA|nr:hypothetical protein EVAR_14510_1 [Eumeta japonica]